MNREVHVRIRAVRAYVSFRWLRTWRRMRLPSADHLSHSAKLMDPLSRKSISTMPKHTNRTPFALVIDPLLVRATDYAIGHCNRQDLMLIHKFQYLAGDTGVGTNITTIYLPVAQFCYFCILGWHNANRDLTTTAEAGHGSFLSLHQLIARPRSQGLRKSYSSMRSSRSSNRLASAR